jgi:transcriptional regulator with XRE-family HTH domain
MTQTARLLETLKHYLKIKGITYRSLGQRLKLSESSVKRLFSDQSLSLKRLEKICGVLGLELYDLVKMSRERLPTVSGFSERQQQELVCRPQLMLLLLLLCNGWAVPAIVEEFSFTAGEIRRNLHELEQLGLIEWLPEDRVRLCIDRSLLWQAESPLWQLHGKTALKDFFSGSFSQADDRWCFANPQLSPESRRLLLRELDRLMQRLHELQEIDAALPPHEREPTGLLLALRSWQLSNAEKSPR